jgi:hypothetical protein
MSDRLTLSEIVRQQLARTRTASSVKITRNAAGKAQFEVHVQVGDQGVDSIVQASLLAQTTFDGLVEKYHGRRDPAEAGDGTAGESEAGVVVAPSAAVEPHPQVPVAASDPKPAKPKREPVVYNGKVGYWTFYGGKRRFIEAKGGKGMRREEAS